MSSRVPLSDNPGPRKLQFYHRIRAPNCCSQADRLTRSHLSPAATASSVSANPFATAGVRVSAYTREGLAELGECVERELEARYGAIPVTRPALTRARQRVAIEKASRELSAFQQHWESADLPTSIAAVHIRSAVAGWNNWQCRHRRCPQPGVATFHRP
jgi:tRNA U34 5-carboxymethylaminomethyl modifying GTPase MnmE/TrmE